VKNEEVLRRVGGKEYPTCNTQIGHILHRNCLLKLVFEGTIEGTGRRGRRRKPLLDETRKCKHTGS
jgi:isoprenylcysteine carboxyl methyltransferase (ICMT) family protein YpbQ